MRRTRDAPEHDRPIKARDSRPRRLIAGLRVTEQDETSLAAVRPLFPDAVSEGELAYRLWRRGLEITLAEAVSLGAALPPGTSVVASASDTIDDSAAAMIAGLGGSDFL